MRFFTQKIETLSIFYILTKIWRWYSLDVILLEKDRSI